MIPGLVNAMMASGGSGVVAPAAVNWDNIVSPDTDNDYEVIAGQTQPMMFQAKVTGFSKGDPGDTITMMVLRNSSFPEVIGSAELDEDVTIEFGPITSGENVSFLVSMQHLVYEGVYPDVYLVDTGTATAAFTTTVRYQSTGAGSYDTTLDTFTVS